MNKPLNFIKSSIKNLPGWRTNRKIVVFESDDWGSIRMPSKETYSKCINAGYRVDKNIFSRYDSLASEDDLTFLFELLLSFHDIKGNHPVITANCLTCNPDFDKIKSSNFKEYHFESIKETFKKYPKHSNCFDLWLEAKDNGIFFPQFHGREHLNVSRFLTDLQNNKENTCFAFENRMPGIFEKQKVEHGNDYVVALEFYDEIDKLEKEKIINEGLEIFKNLFNYKSSSFIATNYVWHNELNGILNDNGVEFIQGNHFQLIPKGRYNGFNKNFHYLGEQNQLNQIYLVRNVYFEPTLNKNNNWIDSAMREIENAFMLKKPAIVSTHRINFVGFIDEKNRDTNLVYLKALLKKLLKNHPQTEFLTSEQLGQEIQKSRK